MQDFILKLYGTDDDNPISLLARRMKVPLIFGFGCGLVIQASKGILETPATFGRILHTSLPICGIGFYYLSGTYIAERIRGRSGPFNDLIGAYCTYPLLRKFLPLSASVAVLFFISLPLYVLARGFKINEARTSFERAASFGIQMTGYDINLMLQKKPSEPFVKRDSYNPFTIPSN
ncbi:uncharacterized protein LOC132906858 [Bombus pascuorum]|uniref:uncharacterized protein LOC132906858 n=1 Tax=Bombus pascuorum TaxID=65598 RepID=UPI00212AC6ED|nr:uncharacterized protein LOC132906858 [Bombus pascuorum]